MIKNQLKRRESAIQWTSLIPVNMHWSWKAILLVMKRIKSGIVCKYQTIVKNKDT